MDLGDIWQAHKRFILGVGAGLVVFLIAKSVIGSTWNVAAAAQQASSSAARIRRVEVPRKAELARVEREVTTHAETMERLVGAMHYATPERYVLPRAGSPDLVFNEIREQATEQLVNAARRQNIDVDNSLGLPEFTPTGREAIQRALRGLSVVEQVVTAAIVAGVSSVDKIEVTKPRGRGTGGGFVEELEVQFEVHGQTGAIADLVESLARDKGAYLAFRAFDMKLDERDAFGRTRLNLTVAALEIDPEAKLPGVRR